jgi:hypothetical protein
LCAQAEFGAPGAFAIDAGERRFLAPLLLREIRGTPHKDVSSPYGYAAPIWSTLADDDFVDAASAAFVEALQAEGAVSAFIRLHPLLPANLEVLARYGDVVHGGDTVYIDLSLDELEHWRQTRENHRRGIRRLERSGFTVRVDDDGTRFADFLDVYRQTMARVGATPFYYFSAAYFAALEARLGQEVHLLLVEAAGEVTAAALFFEHSGIVQYHLGGTRDRFLEAAPMKLLFHFARAWFKERGARVLHLGGGLGGKADALLHFKAGFSPLRARFHTWRIVAMRTAYDALVDDWRRATGEAATTYFPAYRAPR